ncbi:MAG: PD40 domain-containing protein [SAR324 cluster bacterium]|nr:PD40 domain-containing protein [SAR324 cluster bacterium]
MLTTSIAGYAQDSTSVSEKDIIDIIGLNYGRLQLTMEFENQSGTEQEPMDQLVTLLRKNLLWSGMFDIREIVDESDLQLKVRYTSGKEIRALIFSQENILLFDESRTLAHPDQVESTLLELVETIIFQLTGEKSIFRSAIVYVRKESVKSFKKGDDGNYKLVLTDTFGRNSKVLLNDGKLNILPRWNPDGRSVLYTSLGKKGSRLKQIDIETGSVQTLFSEMGKLSGGTWGKNGTELILTLVKMGNSDLYRINLKGQILEQMTSRSSSEANPRWSPDSRRLLFVSNRSGSIQIYQRDLASGDTFRMTFEDSYNVEPSWSNDGANIVFAGIKDKKFQLFLMDKDGQYIQQITNDNASSEQPIWSPNGRQILFVSKVGFDQKLFLIRADGTFKRRLTDSGPGISEFNPTWTPQFNWKNQVSN